MSSSLKVMILVLLLINYSTCKPKRKRKKYGSLTQVQQSNISTASRRHRANGTKVNAAEFQSWGVAATDFNDYGGMQLRQRQGQQLNLDLDSDVEVDWNPKNSQKSSFNFW